MCFFASIPPTAFDPRRRPRQPLQWLVVPASLDNGVSDLRESPAFLWWSRRQDAANTTISVRTVLTLRGDLDEQKYRIVWRVAGLS
jgi:hypothetical protein